MATMHADRTGTERDLEARVPWWALASSGAAPLLLVGGWTIAAGRQPAGFDSVRDTISALAARGATDRWIMTAALAGLGACYAVTGLGLRPAGRPGGCSSSAGEWAPCWWPPFPNRCAATASATPSPPPWPSRPWAPGPSSRHAAAPVCRC